MINKLTVNGSVALAHAIIKNAVKENDQRFLQSDWYEFLKTFCALGDEIITRRQSATKVSQEYEYV